MHPRFQVFSAEKMDKAKFDEQIAVFKGAQIIIGATITVLLWRYNMWQERTGLDSPTWCLRRATRR